MPSKIKILAILFISLFGIFGMLFFWNIHQTAKKQTPSKTPNVLIAATSTESTSTSITDASIPTTSEATVNLTDSLPGSEDAKAYELAIANKDETACRKIISTTTKNTCYANLAVQASNPAICQAISEKYLAQECDSMSSLSSAIAGRDINSCEAIKDEMQRNSCIDQKPWRVGECNQLKSVLLQGRCLAHYYKHLADSTNNSEACKKITDNDARVECIIKIKKIEKPFEDADHDGLNLFQEMVYGTDPNKADTDGDGYNDGDEVARGFNPLGFGYLDREKNKKFIFCEQIKEKDIQNACFMLMDKRIEKERCQKYGNMLIRSYCLSHQK